MKWQPVIGLEIHVQLATQSKIFSGAATQFGAMPNTQACAIDLGLPGTLPVLNEQAIMLALRFGLAIDAEIPSKILFYRKNYFYPDLPKGYQISQLDSPIVGAGRIPLGDGSGRQLAIERAHLEEDAGKSLHRDMEGISEIDLNRAGIPLLEIVTRPEIYSAEEAVLWFRRIHALVCYLGLSDAVMAESSMRCDVNVSVRPAKQARLGERIEIKNLNSFRFVEQALDFEIDRQIRCLEEGRKIVRETRLYDPNERQTLPMRSKEYAEDYRYFPDPDLLPLIVKDEWIEDIRQSLPPLPEQRSQSYQSSLGLSREAADYLCVDCTTADYFDSVATLSKDPVASANWIMGELAFANKAAGCTLADSRVSADALADLIRRINDTTLSSKMAKIVFAALCEGRSSSVDEAIDALDMKQLSDEDELAELVTRTLDAHPHQVGQYRSGKTKLLGFFVGQIMQATHGQANPKKLNTLLRKMLDKA